MSYLKKRSNKLKGLTKNISKHGGSFYSIGIWTWRGYLALQGIILTKIYRRLLHKCGDSTNFGAGVYISYPNRVQVGTNCYIGSGVCLTSELELGQLVVEDHVQISDDAMVDFTGNVVIKKNVLVSARARIISHDHGYDPHSVPTAYELTIEEDAWIGFNAIVLPSVERIGKGAIVGAGAIVTKPVPEMAIVAGNPAKVIQYRNATNHKGVQVAKKTERI